MHVITVYKMEPTFGETCIFSVCALIYELCLPARSFQLCRSITPVEMGGGGSAF